MLCVSITFVKLNAMSGTGGQAKLMIQNGEVKVNGTIETRRRRKLSVGDVVEVLTAVVPKQAPAGPGTGGGFLWSSGSIASRRVIGPPMAQFQIGLGLEDGSAGPVTKDDVIGVLAGANRDR